MDRAQLHARDLVALVRRRAREAPLPTRLELPVRSPLSDSVDLAHLNRHWVIGEPTAPRGPGLAVRLRHAFIPSPVRRWIRGILAAHVRALLEDYLLEEREFLSALVRHQNQVAARVDELTSDGREILGRSQDEAARNREALRVRDEELRRIVQQRVRRVEGLLERSPTEERREVHLRS